MGPMQKVMTLYCLGNDDKECLYMLSTDKIGFQHFQSTLGLIVGIKVSESKDYNPAWSLIGE